MSCMVVWMQESYLNKIRDIFPAILILAALIVLLEMLLRFLGTASYIVPKPTEIWFALQSQPHDVGVAWVVTMGEALIGLGAAVLISSLLAAATIFLSHSIARIINTASLAIQSTPLLAIAPLLSLWLGQAFAAKVAAACIVCFFPLLTGWLAGIRSIEPEQLQLFENMGASTWQRARFLLIPNALPYFFGGLRVAMPLALLGAIVGEFVGASEGIGFRILSNSYYVRTPLMFGYVFIAALSGWALTTVIAMLEKKVLFWHGQERLV